MENYGTEIGLGAGAFLTTILAWLKFKPKPETDMLSILKRVEELEGGQRRLTDFCKEFMQSTKNDYDIIKEDVTEIKADVTKIRDNSNKIQNSVSRMEGIYEATFKRSSRE